MPRKFNAVIAFGALVVIALAPSPAAAFGVRIGPFYFGIPYFGHRHHHRHHHIVHAERPAAGAGNETSSSTSMSARAARASPSPELDSPLLYPALALPIVYDDVFWPSESLAWPFSYEAILRAAFAKPHTAQGTNACPPAGDSTAVGDRIRREIAARGVQRELLRRLNGAFAMAANYLANACPTDVPPDPVARLQLIEWQIEKLTEALDFVRPPLQAFEQSLNTSQQARFVATPAATSDAAHSGQAGAVAGACTTAPSAIDSSVEQISRSVQPTDAQRDAVTAMQHSFRTAATELDSNCSLPTSPSPLSRLQAIQSRLDATWRAVLAVQVGLENFSKQLDNQQRARLDSTDFASAH